MLYKEPKLIDAVTERAVTQLYRELLHHSIRGQAADLFFEITYHHDKRMTTFFVYHFQRRY